MITMFDSIEAQNIPAHAQACAGYVDGNWPDYNAMVRRFPTLMHAGRILSLSTTGPGRARGLDIERHDAGPEAAADHVKFAESAGHYRPVLYAPLDTMPQVLDNLRSHNVARHRFCLFVADWTLAPHLTAEYDACQWTDKAGPDDESLCRDSFFPPRPPHVLDVARIEFDAARGLWTIVPQPAVHAA